MIPSLKEVYKPYFKIGVGLGRRMIKTHERLLLEHFNSITCGNEMKFGTVCKQKGVYDFAGADEMYKFALDNNIEMRGHTLVWHNQSPDFVYDEPDRAGVMEVLSNHMKTMAERFDRGLYAWDVVNEAIDDKSDIFLRQTKWLAALGEDYLADIFTLAKSIFKDKDLYYNDYNESNPSKRDKIIKLIKDFKQRGIPIDGVGLQAHHNIFVPTLDHIKEGIEQYATLGLKISITEMDVSMFRFEDHSSVPAPTADMIENQAEYYRQCFKIFREYSEHIDSVTMWGVADDATWLDFFPVRNRKNWPLLFDENHEPKEAFYRITDF